MPELRQVLLAKCLYDFELVLNSFLPDGLDPSFAGFSEPSPDRTPVFGVRNPFDQAVALEVVDQPGDISRCRVEVLRQITQRRIATSIEAEQHAHPAFGEAMRFRPSLLQKVEEAARDLEGGQGLHCGDVHLQGLQQLPHMDAVKPPRLVDGALLAVELGDSGWIKKRGGPHAAYELATIRPDILFATEASSAELGVPLEGVASVPVTMLDSGGCTVHGRRTFAASADQD